MTMRSRDPKREYEHTEMNPAKPKATQGGTLRVTMRRSPKDGVRDRGPGGPQGDTLRLTLRRGHGREARGMRMRASRERLVRRRP